MFGSNKNANRPTMSIDTLIGAKTRIKGDISFSGGFRVDGHVVGTVISDGAPDAVLTISDQGSVEGEVRAPHVIINGVMKGDVIASERVELAAQARVHGNVHYKVLEMAAGAQITGRVVREDEPRKQLPRPEAVKPEAAKATSDAEFALEAKVEPKDKSKLDAKRV
ncbi:MAG: polymer-forming cytoskeletal protein [Xanthomonadales bacterium]|nr:polymer-forming cytoskeletal protein [Xanthomonadales bacterium]MCC6562745.1 polymer-forming cytoskeletal protein [Xanthomonadales bacterium]